EGVAAFQADHGLALPGFLHEQPVDVLLSHGASAGRLADVDALGPRWSEIEQRGRRQAVVHDDIRLPQDLGSTQREQPGIARDRPLGAIATVRPPRRPTAGAAKSQWATSSITFTSTPRSRHARKIAARSPPSGDDATHRKAPSRSSARNSSRTTTSAPAASNAS